MLLETLTGRHASLPVHALLDADALRPDASFRSAVRDETFKAVQLASARHLGRLIVHAAWRQSRRMGRVAAAVEREAYLRFAWPLAIGSSAAESRDSWLNRIEDKIARLATGMPAGELREFEEDLLRTLWLREAAETMLSVFPRDGADPVRRALWESKLYLGAGAGRAPVSLAELARQRETLGYVPYLRREIERAPSFLVPWAERQRDAEFLARLFGSHALSLDYLFRRGGRKDAGPLAPPAREAVLGRVRRSG